jgi:hypothetical protein
MFVSCECCVLSGRGLCDDAIIRPEDFYRLWGVVVCGLEISRARRPLPNLGRSPKGKSSCFIYLCKHFMKHFYPINMLQVTLQMPPEDMWGSGLYFCPILIKTCMFGLDTLY